MHLLGRSLCTILLLLLCAACGISNVASPHTAPMPTVAAPLPIVTATAIPTPLRTAESTPSPTPFDIDVNLTLLPGSPPFALVNPYALYVDNGSLVVTDLADMAVPRQIWQSMSQGQNVVGLAATEEYVYLFPSTCSTAGGNTSTGASTGTTAPSATAGRGSTTSPGAKTSSRPLASSRALLWP